MEQPSPVPETCYLVLELVSIVIVRMDIFLVWPMKPVDESFLSKLEGARQEAGSSPNTDGRFWEETPAAFRLIVTQSSEVHFGI